MEGIEELIEKETEIAGAVETLVAMINGGRIAAEDKSGVREILELLYKEYNATRAITRALVMERTA